MPSRGFINGFWGWLNPSHRRRQRARGRSFPAEWESTLQKRVPAWGSMAFGERAKLRERILVFLDKKRFEGCAGLKLSDEMRITVAGEACRLTLGWDNYLFPRLYSILLYPRGYAGQLQRPQPDGTVIEGREMRDGESWQDGSIVLAWDAVRRGVADVRDGYNVVLHEFAHQIDHDFEASEGWPPPEQLPATSVGLGQASFRAVMAWEYDRLVDAAEHGAQSVLDPYGAESPQEFFAVATETFFEKGTALMRRHRELYNRLRDFYAQDPAAYPSKQP